MKRIAIVGPAMIEERLPWTIRTYPYDRIASRVTVPRGYRNAKPATDGPWYEIKFDDGRDITLSLDNEGVSESDLSAIAAYLAQRTHRSWHILEGAMPTGTTILSATSRE